MLVVLHHRGDGEDPDAVDDRGEGRRTAERRDERGGGLPTGVEGGELWEGGVEGLLLFSIRFVFVFREIKACCEPDAQEGQRQRSWGGGGTERGREGEREGEGVEGTSTAVDRLDGRKNRNRSPLFFDNAPGSAASSGSKCTPRPRQRAGPSLRADAR